MRSSKRFISLFLVVIMSLTLFDMNLVFAEENMPNDNEIIQTNYTAMANGEANKTTSNVITLVFEEPVPGLVGSDITISAGTAIVTKGTLTVVEQTNDTQYNLGISGVTNEGTVNLKIAKDGVNDAEKIVDIHRIPITFSVANVGGAAFVSNSTAIRLTFNTAVSNLSADDIILSAGTPAAVSNYATSTAEKGSLTKVSDTVYELALFNITRSGTLGVKINKIGIETNQKNVIINAKVNKTALQPTPPRDSFPQDITSLPKSSGLNDLFEFLDPNAGTNGRVETKADWEERKGELKDLIQYYYYGRKYPTPKSAITVNSQINQVNVTIKDNDRTVTGQSLGSVTVPSGTAPEGGWPVIIAFGFGQTAMATQNGYAVISVSNWGGSRTGNYYNLYPFNPYEYDFNTGSIMTAAWSVSRIIDAMEISAEANGGTNQWNINPYKSMTTGVSINGKYALMSAAMDDRVGAAAPVDSGQSGLSSFRYIAEGKLFYYDSPIDKIYRRNQKGLNSIQYSGESFWMGLGTAAGFHKQTDMDYLPFDSHAVEALMAPRPLIGFTADNNFDWTTPPASIMAMSAAKEVYEFLGSDNIAVRTRDGAHAIQDRDVPFMIAVMDKEFSGKPLEVRDLYPKSNPPSYGIGTYNKISDMTISPYDIDSSYIRWSRPGKYTLWTENEIVTEGVPVSIKVHSNDTKVKLTILDADNKPTKDTWTADVVNGTAVFNLKGEQVKIGRYEITSVGTAKDSKTVYFQGVDLATALRHGTARNDNGAAVMYGFTSKINKDLVEVYADGNRLTQSLQEDTEQAWILNYGVATNPNENNRILNTDFNVITLKKLQMEGMPGSTFEISIDKSKLANNQETVSWNASAAVQKIGPQPNWPQYPNSLTDDGKRPVLPVTTTNFKADVSFSLNDMVDLTAGKTLKITFDEPMYKGDFGIGFDFSDDFTLVWAEDNKSVEVTFHNVTKDKGEVCNVYIMRLRDAAGNMIAAPIHHSFTLKKESDVIFYEGFESSNTLQQNGNATISRTQEYAAAGSSSLKVSPTAANDYSGVALRNSSTTTPMLPGGKYKLTAKALSEKNATLSVRVETKDSGNKDTYGTVGKTSVKLVAGQWADVTLEFTVPADHQSVSAIVFHNGTQITDFTFYLDEVKLQVISPPPPVEEPEIKELLRFDFNNKAEQASLFTSAASSKIEWINETGAGKNDDTALKVTHIAGTSYTSADNAVRLTLDKPLPAGGVYNISVWVYAPAVGNEGKGDLTGPGVVLNQDYANGAYKLPSAPGNLPIGQWKEVNVQTPLMERALESIDFRLVTNDAAAHADVWYIDQIVISQVGNLKVIPKWDLTLTSIADAYKDYFLIGNVMSPSQTTDAENTAMYSHHYNVMTPENDMKPQYLSPSKGVYNYDNADTLVNWAQANNIKVHGHTLVWHSQSAPWLTTGEGNKPLTRTEAKANMEQYISNVAGHYKGKVISWDVVNEAFDGGSGLPTDWKTVLRKNSPWYKAYENGADKSKGESGADYIYDAFVLARLADPGATLYYNDYNEHEAWKREAMALMAEDLNEKWKTDDRNTDPERLLVEGIGMQAHYWIQDLNPAAVEASIARFVKAGVKISVTELDIPSTGTLTKEDEAKQAELYAKLFVIFKKYANSIERVTLWGKADSQSWRASGSPLLFDKVLAAKPAYYAVINPEGYLHIDPVTPVPTGVSVKVKSSSEIEVSWTTSKGATGYNVYRSDAVDGTYSKINSVTLTEATYHNTGLGANTSYYYRVTAVSGEFESEKSNYIAATTDTEATEPEEPEMPAVPTHVKTESKGTTSIDVSWTASEGATGYNVYRSDAADGTYSKINSVTVTEATYGDTGLEANTSYYYRVTAVSGEFESEKSDYATATTDTEATEPEEPEMPAVPTHVKAESNGTTSIDISWTASEGATGYNVYRSDAADGTYSKINSVTVTEATYGDTGLEANTSYYYKVTAVSAEFESEKSNYVTATTDTEATEPEEPEMPAVPTHVKAESKGTASIDISWTASEGATGYNVYRSDAADGTYSKINSVTVTEATYGDTGLEANTSYYYKVTAVSAELESEKSNYATATTDTEATEPEEPAIPAAPTHVKAVSKGTSSIEINWAASDNATGYNVYRAASVDGSYSKVNTQLITDTTFSNSGLSSSTTYYYKVAAVNSAGESLLSAVAQAKTNSKSTNPDPTPTSPTDQTPAKPGEVKAEVDPSGNAKALVKADDVKKALSEAKNGTMKLTVLGVENAKQVTVSMPVDQVNAAKEADIKRIEISFGFASVQLPVSLFENAAGNANIEMSVAKVDNSTLSEAARTLVGSNTVYDFILSVDGQKITDFGQGQQVKVEIPYTLKPGESPEQIVIYYLSDDGSLEIVKNSHYNKDTGMVEFNAKHFSKYAATANSVKFSDTKAIVWASDSIDGLAARGIVNGVTKDSFAPGNSITRAEFIQMLMLTLDLNQANATSSFSDVKQGAWYYNSVATAQQLGIVSGLTDGSFGINNKITRQEMAAMAYRAIQKAGITLKEEQGAATFNDAQNIASYAQEAVTAMHKAGIINGVGNDMFDPKGTATRAQAAVILYQLLMNSL